jgi:hypothetical protein
MKKKLALALCLAAMAGPASARNAEDYWCGKPRIHLMMWIAKVQEPMRDDEGKLIRDNEGNLAWARAADGRAYSQYGIINHKLPARSFGWRAHSDPIKGRSGTWRPICTRPSLHLAASLASLRASTTRDKSWASLPTAAASNTAVSA